MSDTASTQPSSIPDIHLITVADLFDALKRGWRDFLHAPAYGLAISALFVVGGLLLWWLAARTGEIYWLVIGVFGFPLLGPFAAVGFYEISHMREQGEHPSWGRVLGVVYGQKNRQIPSLCMMLILLFMFWAFVAHLIFTLFLGNVPMINITTGYDVYLTGRGLAMLTVGTLVGGLLAGFVFASTVVGLPLLLDKEVDLITAIITSIQSVFANFRVMILWGLIVAGLLFVGMLPVFLGLLIVLPVLGHASWYLYRRVLYEEKPQG